MAISTVGNAPLDLAGLYAHAKKNLCVSLRGHVALTRVQRPSYAVPLFIRVTPALAITATLKHQKVDLRNEGMDIFKIKDAMYFLDEKLGKYVSLDKAVFARITTPGARL